MLLTLSSPVCFFNVPWSKQGPSPTTFLLWWLPCVWGRWGSWRCNSRYLWSHCLVSPPLSSECTQETVSFYMGARQISFPNYPIWKRPLGGCRGKVAYISVEMAKVPLLKPPTFFPSRPWTELFTWAARLPGRCNDLWDCDLKRWWWCHHLYPCVSHVRNYYFYIGSSEKWLVGSVGVSFMFSYAREKGWNLFFLRLVHFS